MLSFPPSPPKLSEFIHSEQRWHHLGITMMSKKLGLFSLRDRGKLQQQQHRNHHQEGDNNLQQQQKDRDHHQEGVSNLQQQQKRGPGIIKKVTVRNFSHKGLMAERDDESCLRSSHLFSLYISCICSCYGMKPSKGHGVQARCSAVDREEGPDLSVTVNGLKLPNPFLIASGPPGTNYTVMKRAFDEGWGGVIAKTVKF
jgi:hypothetical protein